MRLFHMLIVFGIAGAGCANDPADPAGPEFASVDPKIESLGLRLSFDLVDGHYTVFADNANDKIIKEAVGYLKMLPQGTSMAELDYDRRFSFFLSNTEISDEAIKDILTLEVTQLRLDGTKVTRGSFKTS